MEQAAQPGRDRQQFVQADAPKVAGTPAFQAADRLVRLQGRRQGFAGFQQDRPIRFIGRRRGTLAMRAQGSHQALGHDPQQGGLEQVVRHAQFEQAADGRRRVVGVQGG